MRTSRPSYGVIQFVLAVGMSLGTIPAAGQSAASTAHESLPKLTYTRVFRGSVPEYLSISVDKNGAATYEGRKLADSPASRPLKLSATTTRRLFDLADRLDDFKSVDLESHKKVADLGWKTFTYEAGGRKSSAGFNYTLDRDARDLTDLLEKIASVEQHITGLEFAIRYDHLGLPEELLEIQIDLANRALADPELMVPTLEEIANNPHFLHLAQVRAHDILQRIQNNN
jgi:hypothetical protein